MTTNLSNANNEDEQTIKTASEEDNLKALFAASYSGNTEESDRLHAEPVGTTEEAEPTEPTEPNEEEEVAVNTDDSIQIASTTQTPAEEAATQTPDPSTDELASVREQLHRAKSDAGRVPHLNRRVQELERELTKLRTPAATPDTPAAIPAHLKTRLEKMKEIDPETAELMEEMFKAANGRTEEVAASYQRYTDLQQQREEEAHLQAEYSKVIAAIPEAEDVFRSPEWENWKSRLTPNHRAMADSIHANEVVSALQAFRVDAQTLFGGYKWGQQAAPATPPAPAQSSPTARAVETSRQNRLANSTTVKDGAARATNEPDLEALFKSAYQKVIDDNKVTRN